MNGFGMFTNVLERVQNTIDANLGIDSEQAKQAMGKFARYKGCLNTLAYIGGLPAIGI